MKLRENLVSNTMSGTPVTKIQTRGPHNRNYSIQNQKKKIFSNDGL